MCGIAGLFMPGRDAVGAALPLMTRCLAHRGPDDYGAEVQPAGGGWVGLGQQRLAIQDLSPAGHQPMRHPPTGSWITFNGEVYNFQTLRAELEGLGDRFVGHSDTEVVSAALARWGPDAFRRFQGMYALAYLDAPNRRLILARDPAGIKPLYLARAGGGVLFASEVRGILASGLVKPVVDRGGMAGYLAYGSVQHPRTLFTGIESVPPGSWLEVRANDGRLTVGPPRVFWTYPQADPVISRAAAVDAVRATLDEAVRDHLIADVPVGLFLSGGVDSTVIAGLAARHSPHIRSFTVGFSDHPDWSETEQAAATARRLGLRHTEINLPEDEAVQATTDWLNHLDQPSVDGLNVFTISRAVRRQGVKVALTGLGGDELFGGYPSFRDVPRLWKAMKWVQPLPAPVRRGLGTVAFATKSHAARAKLADMAGGDGSLLSLALHRRRAMSDRQLADLGLRAGALGLDRHFLPPGATDALALADDDPVWSVSVLESRYYQGNTLLRDADANGMAHGLEIRVPLLDQRLLDLGHAIPGPVRLPPGAPPKSLLRAAAAEYLQADQTDRPKRGFTLPVWRWMAGPLRPMCERATAVAAQVLDPAGVSAVWRSFQAAPESPMWTRAFALVVLGEFCRRHGVG
ncbi:MAG: asparagine synthase (glutamine-hydrolyzing) [Gemmataceae bacterium]